jgi:hypothetical protein
MKDGEIQKRLSLLKHHHKTKFIQERGVHFTEKIWYKTIQVTGKLIFKAQEKTEQGKSRR